MNSVVRHRDWLSCMPVALDIMSEPDTDKDINKKKEPQFTRFDITIPYYGEDKETKNYEDWEALHRKLSGWCNKFSYQLEKGETGYLHWQCRVSLIKKKTWSSVLNDVAKAVGGRWSITSSGVHLSAKAFNYVLKEDTRVEGPWSDEIKLDAPAVMTRQLVTFIKIVDDGKMYPWQSQLLEELKKQDDRWVNHIFDPLGNSGKSVFCEYLSYLKLSHELPMLKDMQDLMGFAFSFSTKPAYVIDMPRGLDKRKLAEFYSGIECLKNGFIFDKRYQGRMKRFDRPQICTFGNAWPDVRLLSQDRWKLWQMCEDKSLKEVPIQVVLDLLIREEAPPKRSLQSSCSAKKAKKA